jgi:hydroxyacylglutathione hydrolase
MSGKEIDDYGFYCSNLIRVKHLEEIILADFDIIPILTPGHTSGSVCYFVNNHVFSGDTVFIEGVGVCDDKGSNVFELYNSIQFLKAYLPKKSRIWPAHSYGQLPGKDLDFLFQNNIYFQLAEENFVKFRMRKK